MWQCSVYGRWDGLIPPFQVLKRGERGTQRGTAKAHISFSPPQRCQLASHWKWFVHSDPHSFGKESSGGSDCDCWGMQTIMEVSHLRPDLKEGCGCSTGCVTGDKWWHGVSQGSRACNFEQQWVRVALSHPTDLIVCDCSLGFFLQFFFFLH